MDTFAIGQKADYILLTSLRLIHLFNKLNTHACRLQAYIILFDAFANFLFTLVHFPVSNNGKMFT